MIFISVTTFIVLISSVLNILQKVHGANFIFGGEARRVCEAYKLICPVKKVCALQSIEWPRTMKFPVCVHDTHVVVKSDICRKPPIPGKCKAQFMRWYFNVHMGTCSWFTYSGCGGNQNKFRTAEECERRCMGTKKELLEERKQRRHNETADLMENIPAAENFMEVPGHDLEQSREPKLIRAPARAAEMIDLTSHITSSLQLSSSSNNGTLTRKEEKKKRRREREKRKRQKNKRNKNKINSRRLKKVDYSTTTESSQNISFLELGSNTDEKLSISSTNVTIPPKLAEFKGRQTAFSHFGLTNRDDKSVWLMDKQFRRHGKKYRNKSKEPAATKSRSDTLDVYSGAKQDAYYDKVKLFEILTHEAKEETNNLEP